MKVKDLTELLRESYPEYLQESYDNAGVQIMFPENEVKVVYISLDIDRNVIAHAQSRNADIIVSHHPLLFRPVRNIVSSEPISDALIALTESRISLYSMHTNYDKVMYSFLGTTLGLEFEDILIKTDQLNGRDVGLGAMMNTHGGTVFSKFLEQVKKSLNSEFLLYSGDQNRIINRVACINGSGGSSIEKIIKNYQPDCIITGDVGYHHMKYAIDSGTCIIDAGHYGTEIIFRKEMAEKIGSLIKDAGNSAEIIVSDVEKNPFRVYM